MYPNWKWIQLNLWYIIIPKLNADLWIRTGSELEMGSTGYVVYYYTWIEPEEAQTEFELKFKNIGTRHGHSRSQSGFGFIHSGFGFLGLSKSIPFGIYKISVRDRFGFYQIRVGVSKSSKNWYNPLYFRVRVPIDFSV